MLKSILTVLSFITLSLMVVISVYIAESIVNRPASIAKLPTLGNEGSVDHDEDVPHVKLNFVNHDVTPVVDRQ